MELIHFLLEFLKDPLHTLEVFLAEYDKLTYIILFAIVFIETGLIVMPLLPGDSLLFAVGMLCSTTGKLEIMIIIPLLIIAALLGDNLNYFVGKKFSSVIKSKEKILFLKKEYIDKTEAFFEKNGARAIIVARFIPILRTIAPFVAGAGSMYYPKYILNCIIGAVLWVVSITGIGYLLGTNDVVKANFEKAVLLIVIISAAPMIWAFIKLKFLSKKA